MRKKAYRHERTESKNIWTKKKHDKISSSTDGQRGFEFDLKICESVHRNFAVFVVRFRI